MKLAAKTAMRCDPEAAIASRIEQFAWTQALAGLWDTGYGRLGRALTSAECCQLRALYAKPELFRSRIDMTRFRFGRGEYQYFAYPLPQIVVELRHSCYARLFSTANEWMKALSLDTQFPASHDEFLQQCLARGQTRPTPLVLRYREGDYNCLHQDAYGDVVFPFQVVVALSPPDEEFTGGELLVVEQRPRSQSAGHAIRLEQGEAVVLTTRYRPAKGARGFYRTNIRHGVSPVLSGERYTLGIIFHDSA